MWQLNIPSALQLISHPTRSVALSLLCAYVCVYVSLWLGSRAFPRHLSQRHWCPLRTCPHTAMVELVQVCVRFGGNLNQMRWHVSGCGRVTSSISNIWKGAQEWGDGWMKEEIKGALCHKKYCVSCPDFCSFWLFVVLSLSFLLVWNNEREIKKVFKSPSNCTFLGYLLEIRWRGSNHNALTIKKYENIYWRWPFKVISETLLPWISVKMFNNRRFAQKITWLWKKAS